MLVLDGDAASQRAVVGNKAANLGALMNHGIRVPPAGCVLRAAYEEHLSATFLATSNGDGGTLSIDDGKVPTDHIRDAIRDRPLSAELQNELELMYERVLQPALDLWGWGAIARSSSTAEDSEGGSFAGVYDSATNLMSVAEVCEGVKECWASAAGPRALAYATSLGRDLRASRMAVLVQAVVPADVAGVMWTMDPMPGGQGRMVIESSWGLGCSVVDGSVTPDHFELSRQGFAAQKIRIGAKDRQICLVGQRLVEATVSPERRGTMTLGVDELTRLGDLGAYIESLFGRPQDIEWAIVGKKLYVLQSRPLAVRSPIGDSEA